MTLAKLINDKRLSAFAVVIGALVATTLWAAELADQPPLSFLSVAAFLLFLSFACRLIEWCDDAHANRIGAIATRSGWWIGRTKMSTVFIERKARSTWARPL
jgi:ABC-type multidrug transport system fused ATPase/permease subunit